MRIAFTTLLLFTFITYGQTQDSGEKSNEAKPNWKIIDGPDYTIHYPTAWDLNQSGLMGTSFIVFSPLETSQDRFRDNVNLLIQDLSGLNIDLNAYTEISEVQVKTLVSNSTLIESKRVKNGPDEYHRMIYTGDQGIFQLKFEQFYWVKNDKAYVLTLACEQDKFSDFKDIGEAILNSFTFKQSQER